MRNQPERYNQLLLHSADLIIICNDRQEIIESSSSAQKAFGYNEKQFKSLSINEIYASSKDMACVFEKLKKEDHFSGNIFYKNSKGEKFACHLSANKIKDVNGHVIGLLSISRLVEQEIKTDKDFQDIVNNVPDIIYYSDINGVFQFSNEIIQDVSGYTKEEVIGKNFIELVDPEHLVEVKSFYQNHVKLRLKKSYLEFKMRMKNGDSLWVGQQIKTKFNPKKPKIIDGFYGVVRIINDRKIIEERLQQSEERYREMFDNSGDLIQSIDLHGNILYVNNSWIERIGYDYPEVRSLNFFDIIHPDSQSHCQDIIAYILAHKACPTQKIEYHLITKNKEVIIVQGSITLSQKNGEIVSIQSFLRDVTEITRAYEKISVQNKNIEDSLNYASYIQQSTLPAPSDFQESFTDHFVIYEPRDTISGDFYIVDNIRTNEQKTLKTIIVGDCTGHGIPGGVLSILCNGLLKETFTNYQINSPAEALKYVRAKIIKLFNSKDRRHIYDGMDVLFSVFDFENMVMHYASAKMRFYLLRDNKIQQFQGDKHHVGFDFEILPFNNHTIEIKKNDLIIFSSDGFIDQFGGERNRKFTKRRFEKILHESCQEPLSVIQQKLIHEIKQWQGEQEQTDDITIIGIRV